MPNKNWLNTQSLKESLLSAVWRQWADLGATANVKVDDKSQCVIDPEALILASLCLIDDEPRLADIVVSWIILNSDLLSIQRINNLKDAYPSIATTLLPRLAKLAYERGKDARWKTLFDNKTIALDFRDNKIRSVRARMDNPPALLLRLRGIFGIGIRPDVIAFLMRKANPQEFEYATDIADAIGYSRNSVKRVLDDLVEAESLVELKSDVFLAYSIFGTNLFKILDLKPERLPIWRYCHQVFVVTLNYLAAADEFRLATSEFLLNVKFSEFMKQNQECLIASRIVAPQNIGRVSLVGIEAGIRELLNNSL